MNDPINAKEVATMLRCKRRTVVEKLRKRKGFPPAYKPLDEYLWSRRDVQQWLNKQVA